MTTRASIFVSAMAVAAALPLIAGTASADPDIAPTCQVPAESTEQMLVMWGNVPAVPAGIRGDNLTLVRFTGPGTFRYSVVGVSGWQEGTFTRESSAPGVAVFHGTEHTTSDPIEFTITLTCRTETTGNYSYTTPSMPEPLSSDAPAVYRFAPLAK
ncbi:hypothetical protein [Nocardia sp. NPDC057668]|uniref:hypothetical protein n=1 Tax=Nocardia sp. NPDC057668 TaxID=3346202 RepID=UPI00366D3F6C